MNKKQTWRFTFLFSGLDEDRRVSEKTGPFTIEADAWDKEEALGKIYAAYLRLGYWSVRLDVLSLELISERPH